MKLILIVGMPGSGKSDVLRMFEEQGIPVFNMGDVVTRIEPARRGITEINAYIENEIREDIRKKLGPAAVAVRTAEEVSKFGSDIVAVGGLHTFAELEYFRERFGDDVVLVAIKCSKETRMKRIARRKERPLTGEEFEYRESRYAETFDVARLVEQADIAIENEGTKEELRESAGKLIAELKA